MKISTKGRYALRVMLDLALHSDCHCVALRDIADRQGVSVKYLEQIVSQLTRAGYINSVRGNAGGYYLAQAPQEYRVGDILRVMEGSLAPIVCLEHEENDCPRKEHCLTLQFWCGLDKVINEYVDGVTLADLLPKAEETPQKSE